MGPSTVLFLAANPVGGQPLQLGEECRAIQRKIDSAAFCGRIRLVSQWAARPCDLLEALTDHEPTVLHFSGHGAGHPGLYFQGEDGSSVLVSAEALAEVMRAESASVKLAVLNACFSEVQAKELMTHIPCVIGMPGMIGDKAAILYAAYVYRALASGKSVARAHQHGIAALALHRSHGDERDAQGAPERDAQGVPVEVSLRASRPHLLTQDGTDADQIYIVHVASKSLVPDWGRQAQRNTLCVLTVKATLEEFDEHVIARVRAVLRQVSNDVTLEIADIEEGSVRLTLSLSSDAANMLLAKRSSGELLEVCGFEVAEFELVTKSIQMSANATLERTTVESLVQGRQVVDAIRRTNVVGASSSIIGFEPTVGLARVGSQDIPGSIAHVGDPDADVLALVDAGNFEGALRKLIHRHGKPIYRFCSEQLRNEALADDVQQHVFIEAYRGLPRFRRQIPLRVWLFGIARHRVLDAAKQRRRERLTHSQGEETEIPAASVDPDEALDDTRRREALVSCLDRLDPEVRSAILLHYQVGLTYEDMAELCGEKPKTLEARVARALPLLRRNMERMLGHKLPGRTPRRDPKLT